MTRRIRSSLSGCKGKRGPIKCRGGVVSKIKGDPKAREPARMFAELKRSERSGEDGRKLVRKIRERIGVDPRYCEILKAAA